MNVTTDAKNILCFGDSNTHGQRSDTKERWGVNVRWTAQLQTKLGDGYYVIEEGLNSRTTDLDYSAKPGRNGRSYLRPCIETHNPVDAVLLMLGTNDLKTSFNRSAQDIAEAVRSLVRDIKEFARTADGAIEHQNIYLISPVLIDSSKELFMMLYEQHYDITSQDRSYELADAYRKIALEEGVTFFDAAAVAEPGIDGIHFSKGSHDRFSTELAELIVEHL